MSSAPASKFSLQSAPFEVPDVDLFAVARRLEAPVWVFDIDHARIVFANPAACHLWQAKDEEALCGRDLGADMTVSVAKRLQQYQADFIARDARFNEMWTLYPNGKPRSVMVVFSGFRLADGRMGMMSEVVGGADDQPDNLRSAEALLHTDVMISLYENGGPALYLNPAARNALQTTSSQLSDQFASRSDFSALMSELVRSGEHRCVVEVTTSEGLRWHDISAKACSDAVTGKPSVLVTSIDVSELKNARDTARYLADRDLLTGCYNRAFLLTHMNVQGRRETDSTFALVYLDVDHFKLINDQFGHDMGDFVLKEVAARCRSAMRAGDVLARLGGDEFVLVFENIGDGSAFTGKVDELLTILSQPIAHGDIRVNVAASIGISVFSPGQSVFADVLREADIALYASKQAGRNRATFFNTEMGIAARERDEMVADIKLSLAQRDFMLHFQPRVDLQTGQVVSAEALVRWNHPTRGMIMPDKFIGLCEETGMIEELGEQVLQMGFEQALAWQADGLDIELSINISPRQFSDERLMGALETFAATDDFPRDMIELEVTENVLIGNHDIIAAKLAAISEMGYRIAIDDFGTGYSNLSYISRFPLTCLKIDRSFINRLPASGPIINLILTLGRQIDATIVAEGVETTQELDWLIAKGCGQAQGYLLARPGPGTDFFKDVSRLNGMAQENSA